MSRIGNNLPGRPSEKKRNMIKFKTGIPVIDEFYKLVWQYGMLNISKEIGICKGTLRDWMSGRRFPNIKKVCQILDHLGYELLIFEKDEPFEQEE